MARGSIIQRGARWAYVVELPAEGGKRKQEWRSFPDRATAERALTARLGQLDTGLAVRPRATLDVATAVAEWLEAGYDLGDSTYASYARSARLYVTPQLGTLAVGKVTPLVVERWHRQLLLTIKPSTISVAHYVLGATFERLVRHGTLARNPVRLVTPPKIEREEMRYWSREEASAFLAGCRPDRKPFVQLALSTGMRMGELLALAWEDVDLERGVLSVRRTLSQSREGLRNVIREGGKRRASVRRLDLGSDTVALLRQQRQQQREWKLASWEWHDTGLVFTNQNGKQLIPPTLSQWFRRECVRLGVPMIRPHDLRHTYATLSLAEGVPVKTVSERLGHASVAMTLDRYAHVTPGMGRDAAETIDRLIGGA